MKAAYIKKGVVLLFVLAAVITRTIPARLTSLRPTSPPSQTIAINPIVPSDITPPASLQNAALFAWQEFIALNWPAVPQNGNYNNIHSKIST